MNKKVLVVNRLFFPVVLVVASLVMSCASVPLPRAEWNTSTESLKRGITITIPSNASTIADGSLPFVLSGDLIEGATMEGTAREENGSWTLTFIGMKWFNNWADGWTEAHFVIDGEVILSQSDTKGLWKVEIKKTPSLDVPDSASIRFHDTYLTGADALRLMSNRWDRITAVVDWLKEKQPDTWFDRILPFFDLASFSWVSDFSTPSRQKLFPELYQTPGQSVELNGKKALAESVFWDTDFSAKNFPERLRPVRDSGTLLRDWEESTGLWYLAFIWKQLWEQKLKTAPFEMK